MAARRKRITPLVPKDEAKLRHDFMDAVISDYRGQIDELESAIGMYMVGRHFGWKILYLVHSKRTMKKYEEILGIKASEAFEPFGPDAPSTRAFELLQHASNFWKVVSGEEKLPLDREQRRSST